MDGGMDGWEGEGGMDGWEDEWMDGGIEGGLCGRMEVSSPVPRYPFL